MFITKQPGVPVSLKETLVPEQRPQPRVTVQPRKCPQTMKQWWSHKYQPFSVSSPTLGVSFPHGKAVGQVWEWLCWDMQRDNCGDRELWGLGSEAVTFHSSALPQQLSPVTSWEWASCHLQAPWKALGQCEGLRGAQINRSMLSSRSSRVEELAALTRSSGNALLPPRQLPKGREGSAPHLNCLRPHQTFAAP